MESNRHQFYFTIALIVIIAAGGFAVLKMMDTMTELDLIEASFYNVVRSNDIRLSAEISRGIEEIDFSGLENELESIDLEINNL